MRFGLNGHVCLALSVAFICYSIDNLEASISWNWENPLPQGNRLNGIWGTSRNDVWYVGEDGALGHFDGTAWVRHDVGSIDIWGISGISSKDVWVVGHAYPQPVALHWDGNGWTRTEFGTTGPMFRVWESAPADVWAGGERGLFHWDGSTWSPVLSPLPYNVMGIWGTSPDDVWAWDSDGRGAHWDGTSWEGPFWLEERVLPRYRAPEWVPLRGISALSGTASDDVWAIGAFGTVTHIFHWDGAAWSLIYESDAYRFVAIKALAPDNVWVFGRYGAVLHYDGASWTEVTPSSPGFAEWYSVWVESSSYATSATLDGGIRVWDGRTWTGDAQSRKSIYAVSGTGETLWAVGEDGLILRAEQGVWREVPSGTRAWLTRVLATSSDDAWAAGVEKTLLHWSGSSWERMVSPTHEPLIALFGAAPDDVWVVSNKGGLFKWNGSAWTFGSLGPPLRYAVRIAWANSPRNLWLAEDLSHCVRYPCARTWRLWLWNGRTWKSTDVGGWDMDVGAGWSSGPDDVWVDGGRDNFMHWDGSRWSRYAYPSGIFGTSGLWGDGPGNLWIFGEWGNLGHWNGSAWSRVVVPTRHSIRALWQDGKSIRLAGEGGMVLRGDEEPALK